MMLEVAVGDRIRTVSVVRKGALLHVTLDGRAYLVDARRVDEATLSMLIRDGVEGTPTRSIDASFAAQPTSGDYDVHLAGRSLGIQVRQAGTFGRQKKEGPGAHASGPQRVAAPMPGKIVRVLVAPGDEVKARQGLVVVEAMKMENELRSLRDGRVRELSVVEGQSVDAGTVLLVVD